MGTYLNPGNSGFARIANSEYVDKTGMIGLLNTAIGTTKNLACISRPRRFGKTYAAQMLCAYYDATCDSHGLFEKYRISEDPTYEEHLNKYHVIDLDITSFISESKKEGLSLQEIPMRISDALRREVEEILPEAAGRKSLNETLIELVNKTGRKIVFVLDEWDSIIRESGTDEEAQRRYLNLLRGWFKNNNFTPKAVAAAYMTGILPIKKDGSQSAISDFQEYSMLEPQDFAFYVGFTEDEVQELCRIHGRSFEAMKRWYDGYTVGEQFSVYNPYSVMQALTTGKYKSYWKKTSAAEALMTYIDMDQDGLQDDIARLIAGESIVVDPDSFRNDVETFTSKDDVLTLLIHLGYLTYEEVSDSFDDDEGDTLTGLAGIPNEEVRLEFEKILRKAKHKNLIELVRKSDRLLRDTIAGNAERVAEAIQEVHDTSYAPTFYNNEQSLRYVVKMAYISCVDQYARVEELPSGHGIADVVFLPKRRSALPAMIVELKWNQGAEGAIAQIKNRNYPKVFEHYKEEVILVGISYDADLKKHSCTIERYQKQEL
ncbi:MAG: AAA family ATPase [Eubacteriales bacterium]|nr:AAA family ATPase [Eubacteriales bacterium]